MNFGVIMYQTSQSKGQELVAQRMVAELNRQGHKAYLIAGRYHDSKQVVSQAELRRNGGALLRDNDVLGIPVIRVASSKAEWPPRRVNFDNFMPVLDRLVQELDIDVLITHSTLWNGPEIAARFVAWNRRLVVEGGSRRNVLLCHMSHYQPPSDLRYSVKERTYREVWNEHSLARIILEADLLLVTTPLAASAMMKLGAMKEQCFIFPGGIEIPASRTNREIGEFRAQYGLTDSRIVSYVGTIEERKNPMAFLKVAESLQSRKDLSFVLAGRSEGGYGRTVLNASKRLRNVFFLGEISEREKASLIHSSYLNLTMSRLEALGLVQLEFMSAGVPVVTSGVGGQSWVVQDGHTGVVVGGPDDIAGASNAIVYLLQNESKRNWMGRNAQEFASQFSMQRLASELVARLKGTKSKTLITESSQSESGSSAPLGSTQQ